jgi:hypothetical protein
VETRPTGSAADRGEVVPLRNAWRRCPAGAAFANKTDFLNCGGQGDNKSNLSVIIDLSKSRSFNAL